MTPRREAARRLRPRTLRTRITLLAGLAVLGVLAATSAALVVTQQASLTEALDESLGRQADVVAQRLRSGDPVGRGDLVSDDVAVETERPGGEVVRVPGGLTARLPDVRPPTGGTAVTTVDLTEEAGPARLLVRDVGGTTVRVAGSLDDVRESAAALIRALALAVPLASLVLAGVVWWAVGRAVRPVEEIRAQVDSISAAHLDRRVPEPAGPLEITRLARTMNAMLGRLQRSAEQQRRFVADASHELRSPLARMRTELEVDRAHPASADPAATAGSVLDEVVSLQRLVDDLLLLARGDAGAPDGPSHAPLDLDAVVTRVAGRAPAQVDARDVRPAQVRGNAGQLAQAVTNLLDNAVRHARSRVTVTLDETDGRAVLVVADDGPGIPAQDHERVFGRFTRLDDARGARDGGAGLGLAIARDIAERHGGTLTLEPDGPGARFVLSLPLAPVRAPDQGNGRISRERPG
jgi:signal transduction histidine kinase